MEIDVSKVEYTCFCSSNMSLSPYLMVPFKVTDDISGKLYLNDVQVFMAMDGVEYRYAVGEQVDDNLREIALSKLGKSYEDFCRELNQYYEKAYADFVRSMEGYSVGQKINVGYRSGFHLQDKSFGIAEILKIDDATGLIYAKIGNRTMFGYPSELEDMENNYLQWRKEGVQ